MDEQANKDFLALVAIPDLTEQAITRKSTPCWKIVREAVLECRLQQARLANIKTVLETMLASLNK